MRILKEYEKLNEDQNIKACAYLTYTLRNEEKREKLFKHYALMKKGNVAEDRVCKILRDLNDNFTGVFNIRIDKTLCEDERNAEFDFIVEDKSNIVYINVKASYSPTQNNEAERHVKILKKLSGNEKKFKLIKVNLNDEVTIKNLHKHIEELNKESKGSGDLFCRMLIQLDRPYLYVMKVMNDFKITNEDFIHNTKEKILPDDHTFKDFEMYKTALFKEVLDKTPYGDMMEKLKIELIPKIEKDSKKESVTFSGEIIDIVIDEKKKTLKIKFKDKTGLCIHKYTKIYRVGETIEGKGSKDYIMQDGEYQILNVIEKYVTVID